MIRSPRRLFFRPTALLPRLAAAGLALASLSAAHGQPAGDQAPAPKVPGTVFVVERAALDRILVDPRDAGLKNALSMLPARVAELPAEIPNMPPEVAPLVQTFLRTIARPVRVTVTYSEAATGGLWGYGVILSAEVKDQAEADQLHATIQGLVAQADQKIRTQPSSTFVGMTEFAFPGFAVVNFGPRQSASGLRYEVLVGTVQNPDAGSEALPKPFAQGFEPVVRGRLDLHGFSPAVEMVKMISGNPPQMQEMLKKLGEAGIIGPHSMKLNFQAGHTETESVSYFVVEGAGAYAARLHMTKDPVTPENLAVVPADACAASVGKGDFSWVKDLLAEARKNGAPVDDFLGDFKDHTGVDLEADIIDTLGGTVALYMSDSTGGGSLLSGVAMITFKDRAKFAAAHEKLVKTANAMTARIPNGGGKYVRITPWKDGDSDLVSVRFPGLPVPLEVTWAMTKNWLILSPTPQGCIAAARQASGKGDEGLGSNPAFAAQWPKGKSLTSVSFLDTARYLRGSYPFVSLLGSAIANAVRTPGMQGRDPGLVIPLYNDLRKGVRASVGYSYWKGDDWVMEQHGDRSVIVNGAGAVGALGEILPLIVIPAAIEGAHNHGEFGLLPDRWEAPVRALAAAPGAWPFLLSPMTAEFVAAGVVRSSFAPDPIVSPAKP